MPNNFERFLLPLLLQNGFIFAAYRNKIENKFLDPYDTDTLPSKHNTLNPRRQAKNSPPKSFKASQKGGDTKLKRFNLVTQSFLAHPYSKFFNRPRLGWSRDLGEEL